jgi:hypothetical protein
MNRKLKAVPIASTLQYRRRVLFIVVFVSLSIVCALTALDQPFFIRRLERGR